MQPRCLTRRDLAKMAKKKFLGGGGEVYADVPVFLLNQVVSTLVVLMLYQRIFQRAFE